MTKKKKVLRIVTFDKNDKLDYTVGNFCVICKFIYIYKKFTIQKKKK